MIFKGWETVWTMYKSSTDCSRREVSNPTGFHSAVVGRIPYYDNRPIRVVIRTYEQLKTVVYSKLEKRRCIRHKINYHDREINGWMSRGTDLTRRMWRSIPTTESRKLGSKFNKELTRSSTLFQSNDTRKNMSCGMKEKVLREIRTVINRLYKRMMFLVL